MQALQRDLKKWPEQAMIPPPQQPPPPSATLSTAFVHPLAAQVVLGSWPPPSLLILPPSARPSQIGAAGSDYHLIQHYDGWVPESVVALPAMLLTGLAPAVIGDRGGRLMSW